MRKPAQPAPFQDLLAGKITEDPDFLPRALADVRAAGVRPYLPWDRFRFRTPPEDLSLDEWWLITRLMRQGMQRRLPLIAADGSQFTYALPDEVLRGIEVADKHLSGRLGVPEPVTHDAPSRARYVVSSLIEEAITSSQLEGASTTRRVAKDMLRSGRPPRTRDERMILNNYRAMRLVGELRREDLNPALICELHRVVTDGTLDDPGDVGRFQLPGEDRVVVEDMSDGSVLHRPPAARELPDRLQRLCDFANGASDGGAYVPPVVRSIVVHFMLAYDHPFTDGNGRLARVLFYWSLLHQDYWLAEFLPISRLLRQAPAKYARSFLYCEGDDGDLTYFVIYQLGIVERAINDLQAYLERKVVETRRLQQSLALLSRHLNYRQVALLGNAIKNPGVQYTVQSHSVSHNVAPQTARTDLQDLERQGMLIKIEWHRGFAWRPAENLRKLLSPASGTAPPRRRGGRSSGSAAPSVPPA